MSSLQLDRVQWLLYVTILLSFLGGYIQNVSDNAFYIVCLIIMGLTFIIFLSVFSWDQRVYRGLYFLSALYISLIIIMLFYWQKVFISYAFFAFLLNLIFLFSWINFPLKRIIKVLNSTFIIYSLLSFLVYFGILGIGRELNWFPINILGFQFQTLVGFFGSTAWLDAYATIILLMNLMFKVDPRWKWVALYAGLLAFFTFRSTPYLLVIVYSGSYFIKSLFRFKIFLVFVLALIFMAFFFPFLLKMDGNHDQLFAFIDFALTGRAHLWTTMLNAIFEKPFENLIWGFGNVNSFPVAVWHGIYTNPHNAFFRLFIEGGIIFYILIFMALSYLMTRVHISKLPLLFAILTIGISNSMLFQFQNLSIVFLLVYLLLQHDEKDSEAQEQKIETKE